MPDKPRTFEEVVAAQDPADRARLANSESFEDVTVNSPLHRQVTVIARTATARRSLLITANQPFGEWGKIFADQAMTLSIDRLVHTPRSWR